MGETEEIMKMLKDHEKRISSLESAGLPAVANRSKKRGNRKSIPDLLLELKIEGIFKKPIFAGQIVDRLAEKGHHYAPTSLTWALQNAVKTGVLGRIKKDDQWAYVNR